jgi:hypothetical protein
MSKAHEPGGIPRSGKLQLNILEATPGQIDGQDAALLA